MSELSSESPTTDIVAALREAVPHAAVEVAASLDMPTVYVRREDFLDVCRALRDTPALQFALLAEITAADFFPVDPRFELVYHLACLGPAYVVGGQAAPARRLRMKVRVSGDDAHMPSLTGLYPAAGWLEREVYDLFGIDFEGHENLTRIMMPDEWEGHPLRKDYGVGKVKIEFREQPLLQIQSPGQSSSSEESGQEVDDLGQTAGIETDDANSRRWRPAAQRERGR
jgi:NADH-quinone oxidoreductase subunit C